MTNIKEIEQEYQLISALLIIIPMVDLAGEILSSLLQDRVLERQLLRCRLHRQRVPIGIGHLYFRLK